MFVDAEYGQDKVTSIYTNGLFSVVGSTPTTWTSKHQTTAKTPTFGAEFTALKEAVEDSVML